MGVDHSNMVLPHRVPHIRPSASTTPTPHLHSHTSTCPQHVPTRHDKSTHCRHMPLCASSSSDPGDAFGLLQHYCRLPGCRNISRPPPPHLTSTPAPLPVPTHHNKTTHRMDMPLSVSCSSNPVHGSRPLKHGFRASGAEDTPFRVHHPHTSPPLPLLYMSPSRCNTPRQNYALQTHAAFCVA